MRTVEQSLRRALQSYQDDPGAATLADLDYAWRVCRDAPWLLAAAIAECGGTELAREQRNRLRRAQYAVARGPQLSDWRDVETQRDPLPDVVPREIATWSESALATAQREPDVVELFTREELARWSRNLTALRQRLGYE